MNGSSETGTPILQIFLSDGSAGGSIALVHADPFLDGTQHGGEGVYWSPANRNQLIAPFKWDAPFISGGDVGEATALFLTEAVTGAGNIRQLTFPGPITLVTLAQAKLRFGASTITSCVFRLTGLA